MSREHPENLFEKPRWPGGPHLCLATNLPAFETVESAKALTRTVDGDSLKSSWTCSVCGMIHAEYTIRSPAGSSSGAGRVPCYQASTENAKKLAVQPGIEKP